MSLQEQILGKPRFWDRVWNVFTNELAKETDIRRDERDRVTTELNHQLLETARDVQSEWQSDLVEGRSDREQAADSYRSYLEGLSAAQQYVREFNPRLEASLDPEKVRSTVEQAAGPVREQQAHRIEQGYAESLAELNQQIERARAANPTATVAEQRETMRQIAIDHSDAIRWNQGDRGSGMESLEHPDIETGRRRAIRDWSHEWNRRLKTEVVQEQARQAPDAIGEALAKQEELIRKEWLADLQIGRVERHALDSYFAGRIDQHNDLIEMAVAAHPDLRETLPPRIAFEPMREQLREQLRPAEKLANPVAELARQEARYIQQIGEQQRFGIAV